MLTGFKKVPCPMVHKITAHSSGASDTQGAHTVSSQARALWPVLCCSSYTPPLLSFFHHHAHAMDYSSKKHIRSTPNFL